MIGFRWRDETRPRDYAVENDVTRAGRKAGEYTQLHRVLRALDLLRARHFGMHLEALSKELGVSERQTRRDLKALDAAGHVVEFTRVEGRSVACLRELQDPRIALSERERYALLAMRRVFGVLEGTPLAEDVTRVLQRSRELTRVCS